MESCLQQQRGDDEGRTPDARSAVRNHRRAAQKRIGRRSQGAEKLEDRVGLLSITYRDRDVIQSERSSQLRFVFKAKLDHLRSRETADNQLGSEDCKCLQVDLEPIIRPRPFDDRDCTGRTAGNGVAFNKGSPNEGPPIRTPDLKAD